jgi:Flp pilus assembly protein TadG
MPDRGMLAPASPPPHPGRPQRHRRHRARAGGQIIVTFALTFTLFLVGLIALVADVSTMFGASANVNQAAQAGAYAAAADIDYPTFRATGVVQLMTDGSVETICNAAIKAAMGTAAYNPPACTVAPIYEVTVTVTSAVALPLNIGFAAPTVSATYSAFAQSGTTIPQGN